MAQVEDKKRCLMPFMYIQAMVSVCVNVYTSVYTSFQFSGFYLIFVPKFGHVLPGLAVEAGPSATPSV